ncbi:carcinine hydrolase/isopenicillin-N N-acyltransferase family protein [Propionispira arboris]|nr:carcinine hydrolase/isopenicillin-N N-acyltransferase family protein [Propionispira arboris]
MMCTIGAVYDGNSMISFKQCDLTDTTNFLKPEILQGEDDIQYVKFGRENTNGLWAGLNNYGVSFVAADSYLTGMDNHRGHHTNPKSASEDIFTKYREIVSNYKTAKEAADAMVDFYTNEFKDPDILLISDASERYFIEAYNGEVINVKLADTDTANYFASTNHFRYIHGGTTFPENHSTYLRLQRAESILQQNPSQAGVENVLQDQYYGSSVLSICRESTICPRGEAAFNTMASVIMVVHNAEIKFGYQINGNPRNNAYTWVTCPFNNGYGVKF